MQMQIVETNAGAAIWAALSRIAWRSGLLHAEEAVGVLEFHRGVVHEDADRQGHAAQRHDVERLAQRPQHDDRHEDRQRDRRGDDERAAPRAEEEQDHQGRQAGGDGALFEHPLTAAWTNTDWSKRNSILSSGGSWAWIGRHGLAEPLDHADGGGALGLQHGHQHGPASVAADDVGLHREPVQRVGHVLDVDRHAVDRPDGQEVEPLARRPGCC